MEDSQLYWHIELYSGEIIKVKPDAAKVSHIQNLIVQQSGAITTPTRSIIIKDIKDFRISDEMYTDQKLLEGASQAFNEPLFTKDGAVKALYVKKSVSRRRWESYYSKSPGYQLLSENEGYVIVVFKLAIHDIDHRSVSDLTPEEELRMSNRVASF